MTEVVTEENDDFLLSEIDWDALLQSIPQDPLDFLPDPSPEDPTHPISVPSSISFTSDKFLEIEQDKFVEIEQFLLEDGNEIGDSRDGLGDYFSDLLVDLSDSHSADTTLSCAGIPTPESHGDQEEKEPEEKEKSDDSDVMNGQEDDPISKKRKRQMRNRDSAMKSRERKKEYVRDLETKSKFLEGECRRLDYALRCCVADNQFLQQQLQLKQEASGASLPKQESAVLPLESLPLGSLFWLMLCIVCHFLLPATVLAFLMRKVVNLRLNKLSCATAEAVRRAGPAAVAGGNKEAISGSAVGLSFKRRRWKATKWKMRCTDFSQVNTRYSITKNTADS